MSTHSPALAAGAADHFTGCNATPARGRRVPNYVSERLGDNDQWCVHRTRRLHFERSESLFFPGCRCHRSRAPPVRSGQPPATRQRIFSARPRSRPADRLRARTSLIANFASRAIAPPPLPRRFCSPITTRSSQLEVLRSTTTRRTFSPRGGQAEAAEVDKFGRQTQGVNICTGSTATSSRTASQERDGGRRAHMRVRSGPGDG